MDMSIGSTSGLDLTTLFQNLFKKVDNKNDGGIDKSEFEAAVFNMASDQNVSTDETDAMFAKLDTNSDGTVSNDEMMAALKAAGEQRHAHHGHHMPPPPDQNGNGPDFVQMAQDLLKNLDTGGDGNIDKTEFSTAVSALSGSQNVGSTDVDTLFSKLDMDSDGKVTQSELEAALKNMRPPMPPSEADAVSSNDGMSLESTVGGSDDTALNGLFSDLVISLNSTGDNATVSGQNSLFADLIKSLQSSDQNEDDIFSELIKSLQSSSGSGDDQITALFSGLTDYLQNSANYSQAGSLSLSASMTQSLLSVYA